MGRVEGLLQWLVDIQMSNLRPPSHQPEHEMPAVQPSPNINDNQDIEYIDKPEPVPVRERHRAHFAEQVSSVEETRVGMPDNDEMAILINLKRLRLRQQAVEIE